MRVFWITSADITSGGYGGAVYTNCILQALRAVRPDWDLTVFGPKKEDRPGSSQAHHLRQIRSLLRSAFGGEPAKVRFGYYPELSQRIEKAARDALPDLIILDSIDTYKTAMPALERDVPYIVVVHNLEGQTFAQSFEFLSQPARLILRCLGEPERYARYESKVLERAGGYIHISESDMNDMPFERPAVQILPYFSVGDVPLVPRSEKVRLGYLGKLTWWQNKQGLDWFLREVWPIASAEIELHLWGEGSEVFDNPTKRIHGHGFARELSDVWTGSDIMLVPAVSSGGVNVKLCESLANGKPVLATPLALRGLPKISEAGLVVCQSPQDWQSALSEQNAKHLMNQSISKDTRKIFMARSAEEALDTFLTAQSLTPVK